MKRTLFLILLVLIFSAGTASAKVVSQPLSYMHDGVSLEGYLAYDDAVSGKAPGILVVHEWWGLNDYVRSRAEQLARMGYVAFALDMYGKGKSTEHPDEAAAWMKEINANMDQWLKRAMAGLDVLKKQPSVDTQRMAAVGYCFGGATVQVLAYGGADLKGVVSFHGSLIPPSAKQAAGTQAKILICHGAQDPMNAPETLTAYVNALNASSIDWQLNVYGGTRHSFTNPDADKRGMAALAYNASADRRSWQHMTYFFDELFAGM
ncbi:dienelactone hydrolase family protein [Desulfosarcina sp.]|uniref:dienelactone hydrolase family protein n=1 Tax=Desulfosarcina sp. TaxID=2027861 RepID=UPI003567CF43